MSASNNNSTSGNEGASLVVNFGDIPGTQTLRHGLSVIHAVAVGARNLKDVVKHTGLSRSKAHRMLQTLRLAQYLRMDENGTYYLGPALIELGFLALDEISLVGIARPILQQLSEETHDAVHLGTELEGEALYLLKFAGDRGIEVRSQVGARRSIPRTGLGRALVLDVPERWEELYRQDCKRIKRSATKANVAEFVAQMKDFAREGISRDMEDNEPGIRCVAAPVRDAQGHIVAAISVSSAVMYMDETRMNELAKKVRGVAEKISTQLGYNALNALESRP